MQNKKDKKSIEYHIINAYLNKDLSPSLRQSIADWLAEEKDVEKKNAILKELWQEELKQSGLEAKSAADPINKEALAKLKSHIDEYENTQSGANAGGSRRVIGKLFLRAAVVFVPLIILSGAFLYINSNRAIVDVYELVTGLGEPQDVKLPDGSEVHLAENSTLQYRGNKQRSVDFTGKSQFRVASDEEKVFNINIDDFYIKVVGTVFNVDAYPEDEFIEVLLLEGALVVGCGESEQAMKPNELYRFSKKTKQGELSQLSESETVRENVWTHGDLVCSGLTAMEIITEIEERYSVKVEIRKGVVLSDLKRYLIKFNANYTIEQAMRVLHSFIGGFNYRIDGDVVAISSV